MEDDVVRRDFRRLLEYAELAVKAIVLESPFPPLPTAAVLDECYGAFCTLKRLGALRGCIGNFAGTETLGRVLPRVIREAVLKDPRFHPVTADELPDLSVSLSILYPAVVIPSPQSIETGRDGVILTVGTRRAVFLPEVAVEQGWGRKETLDALCRKAGLPPGRWLCGDARLETFRTTRIVRDPPVTGEIVIRGDGE